MINGIKEANGVVQIRYFELACKMAAVSKEVAQIVQPVMRIVFDQFFEGDDPLSQMAIMDFIGGLS